jgi:hypothetical protein
VMQITLFFLLIPRFWQRGVVVAYWQRAMVEPVIAPVVTPVPVAPPVIAPVTPSPAPVPEGGASPTVI